MQDDVLAEQLQHASDRAQKWKGRCAKLRQELLQTQTAAASLQAALNVSLRKIQHRHLSCCHCLLLHCM